MSQQIEHVPAGTPRNKPASPERFTDAWVKKLKKPTKAEACWYFYEELGRNVGLRLLVSYSGRMTWRCQAGKENLKIGTFCPEELCRDDQPNKLSCRRARERALQVARDSGKRENEKKAGNFGPVAMAWYVENVEGKIRTAREVRRVLNKDLACWSDVPFAAIRRTQVMELLDQHPPAMANHVLSIISSIFTWQAPRMHDGWTSPIEKAMRRRGLQPRQRVLAFFDTRTQRIVADDHSVLALRTYRCCLRASAATRMSGTAG
jgi:hypothetical protein